MSSLSASRSVTNCQNSRPSASQRASANGDTTRIKFEDGDEDAMMEDSEEDDDDEFEKGADVVSFRDRGPVLYDNSRITKDVEDISALAPRIKWPHHVLIVNYNSTKHSIMKQFVKPHTYSTRIVHGNPDLNLSASQLKAAYVYAINDVKDQVDTTQLRLANPGLDEAGVMAEAERQIQEVIDQV